MNVADRVYWSASDEFGMARQRADALDRIGVALHRLDVAQTPEARAVVERLIANYDKKAW